MFLVLIQYVSKFLIDGKYGSEIDSSVSEMTIGPPGLLGPTAGSFLGLIYYNYYSYSNRRYNMPLVANPPPSPLNCPWSRVPFDPPLNPSLISKINFMNGCDQMQQYRDCFIRILYIQP